MTGYAYKEISGETSANPREGAEERVLSIEIKSYNSRFLDLSVYMPGFLGRIESRVRDAAKDRIQRGKVDINIRIRENSSSMTVSPDINAAKNYHDAIEQIARHLGHKDAVPLSLIVAQEGVLRSERESDPETYWQWIEPVLTQALTEFDDDRKREGENLTQDILAMTARIEKSLETITSWMPEMEKLFKDNITARFKELLGDAVDEQRVMQETAAMLMKYTINEEAVRLGSHLSALRQEIEHNPAPGKKIDFICQEINREINTIGSKNQILEVGKEVIDAKDALENIREQIRNIE
jgi:uncharacterized protein (TIGR00255 family)